MKGSLRCQNARGISGLRTCQRLVSLANRMYNEISQQAVARTAGVLNSRLSTGFLFRSYGCVFIERDNRRLIGGLKGIQPGISAFPLQ